MCKYDFVEKISFISIISVLCIKDNILPYFDIRKKFNLPNSWQKYYFNWGRNALYYLFKTLPYETIAFPAFTCPTLSQAAEKAGKKILLIECDLNTMNIDVCKIPIEVECLVAVHTFGNPLNIAAIRSKHKNLYVIEDCAHALYTKINDHYVGHDGDAILFSFYKQVQNINGALLLTKNKLSILQREEILISQWKRLIAKTAGWHQLWLNKKRELCLPEIQPFKLNTDKPNRLVYGLFKKGIVSLSQEIIARKYLAKVYDNQVALSSFLLPQALIEKPSYYYYNVRLKPEFANLRNKLLTKLRQKHIFLGRMWHDAPITDKKYKRFIKNCPNALLLAKSVINLPIYAKYSVRDVEILFHEINQAMSYLIK